MNGQHHFEKTQFSRESRIDQDADFYLREWETSKYESDVPRESSEGKIIARMPDLGEHKKNSLLSPYQSSVRKFTNRIYCGLVFCFRIMERTVHSLHSFSSKTVFQKSFVSRLTAVSLILLLIGGGVWIHKSNREKQKLAGQITVQNVEPGGQTTKTEKSAQVVSVQSSAPATHPEISVEKTKKAEKIEKTEKTVAQVNPVTPPVNPVAKVAEKTVDKAAASTVVPKTEEKKNSDSPWERPVTDNYSPWTMNSPERQQLNSSASGTEQAHVTTNQVTANPAPTNQVTTNPAPTVNSPTPTIPPVNCMVPMTPIEAIKSDPSVAAPAIAANYPVAAPYAAAPGQQAPMPTPPYHSAPNGTVTVYAQQQNVPIPQNDMPTYERTHNYVPTAQGMPAYPPQPNMINNTPTAQGNPLPIQAGQGQYPIQYPATSQYPVQYPPTTSYPPAVSYPPVASYPPAYPQRAQDVSYGNGLPIPQAVAMPPMNSVQNIAPPQTYPTMYQQGNSPSPYRRLY